MTAPRIFTSIAAACAERARRHGLSPTREDFPQPRVTPELVASHGLTPDEYQKIVKALGREPNYTELGVFSVMWSEHCSYKSSRYYLKNLPDRRALRACRGRVKMPASSISAAGSPWLSKWKATIIHRSSSPTRAPPPASVASCAISSPWARARSRRSIRFVSAASIIRARAILLSGVVAGIGGYGNCIGVPTVGGECYFDACYNANILVNAFTLGIVKKKRIFTGIAKGVGNPVMYVGSKTGRDGIHGATMASESFSEEKEQRRPTVQVGDPFTEKLLLEACLELMEKDYHHRHSRHGRRRPHQLVRRRWPAAAAAGIEFDLSSVPLRETGMTPYEILLSESQERMLLVAKKGTEDEIKKIFDKWDLDAVVVGRVTDDQQFRALWQGEEVARIPIRALTKEAPAYQRPATRPAESRTDPTIGFVQRGGTEGSRRGLQTTAGVAEYRIQGMDLPPVRSFCADQYRCRARRRCRCDPHQRNRKRLGADRRRQQPLLLSWIPTSAACWRWPKRRAISPASARARSAHRLLEFRQPGKSRGDVAIRRR